MRRGFALAGEMRQQVDSVAIRRNPGSHRREDRGQDIQSDDRLLVDLAGREFAGPTDEKRDPNAPFERLGFVAAQGSIHAGVIGRERFVARAAVVAEKEDQRVFVASRFCADASMTRPMPSSSPSSSEA